MKKFIYLIGPLFLLISCINHYKDFEFKEELSNNFILAKSEVLPSNYIAIRKEKHYSVILDEIICLYGNKKHVSIKTLENETFKYYRIDFAIVEYPEDLVEIDSLEYYSKLKEDSDYIFNKEKGFNRRN